MRPYVICHMVSSVDGRILPDRWHPPFQDDSTYDRLHEQIGGDAWLVGRVTGQEFAQRDAPYPPSDTSFPRETWLAQEQAESWAVVLDAQGKIAWGRGEIGGDPLLVVLAQSVPDSHLAGLRADGVSYMFAGEREIDLAAALAALGSELGLRRVLLEGGGAINGAMLAAGLVDELSLVIAPRVDGTPGSAAVFDMAGGPGALPAAQMALAHCEALEGGHVWLRYRLTWGA